LLIDYAFPAKEPLQLQLGISVSAGMLGLFLIIYFLGKKPELYFKK
jgi:hypothetical protein